jgi:RimJ/RimL family protein N-acetyltransferase
VSASNRGAQEIALRDVEEADLPILFEHQSDPVAAAMAAFPPRDREAFMTHWTNRVLANPNGLKKAILVDGHLAGYIVSYHQNDKRLIGYWIGRHYWGQGIATTALQKFLDHDRTRPLHAFVATQNAPSIRVLQKCGFVPIEHQGDPSADDGVEELLMKLE